MFLRAEALTTNSSKFPWWTASTLVQVGGNKLTMCNLIKSLLFLTFDERFAELGLWQFLV